MPRCLVSARLFIGALALTSAVHGRAEAAPCVVPSAKTLTLASGAFQTFSDADGRPSTSASGDNGFSTVICDQAFSDDVWTHFYMDDENWNNGRGFENFCDIAKMLGRTYIGIWVEMWSSPSAPDTWDDMGGNALAWAANYSAASIDELDGVCGWSGALAATHAVTGISLDDEWTQIWKAGVYTTTPANRAAMIIHEARHADAEGDATHNGNDGSPRCAIAVANACDEAFGSSWNSTARANSVHIWYDSWYLAEAIHTTTFQKNQVRANGNSMLNNRFDTPPGFNL